MSGLLLWWLLTELMLTTVYFPGMTACREENARELEALKTTSRDILDRENR